jgi:hypothetical protein
MLTVAKVSCIAVLLLMGAGVCGRTSAYAQDAAWHVGKSWGDFWINAQVVPGNGNLTFGPGDYIRTGQNGGVILVRGKESILISPNTEVAISKNSGDEISTTINQRTGSITLEVEPSDMKHFEVETPYLAAVAKGSNLRVVVEDNYASVHAFRGEVEVSDFRAGQRVLIMTGQTAKTSIHAVAGLSLSGAGEFAEILQVTPRHSRVTPLTLSPIATSTAVQAPTAEQTSRPGQTLGAGQAYGTGQTDARETKAPIEKFFASPGRNVDAQETKDAIEKLLASSGQKIDARETKAAIENFFALPKQSAEAGGAIAKTKRSFALSENNFSAQDARPLGSIDHNGNEDATQNSSPLLFWAITIGIGVFVTFVAKIFGQKRQTDDRPLDYNY